MTGEAVDYLPAQDPPIVEQFPEIPREQFDTAVQLIESDGAVFSGTWWKRELIGEYLPPVSLNE